MLKPVLVCAFVVVVTGCDSHGPYPSDYDQLARGYFDVVLKDVESARYRVTQPVKCYLRGAPVSGDDITSYGHCALVFVNAKNPHGDAGAVKYRLFFGHGMVGQFSATNLFQERWLSENWAGD